jgi:hypothetical protein
MLYLTGTGGGESVTVKVNPDGGDGNNSPDIIVTRSGTNQFDEMPTDDNPNGPTYPIESIFISGLGGNDQITLIVNTLLSGVSNSIRVEAGADNDKIEIKSDVGAQNPISVELLGEDGTDTLISTVGDDTSLDGGIGNDRFEISGLTNAGASGFLSVQDDFGTNDLIVEGVDVNGPGKPLAAVTFRGTVYYDFIWTDHYWFGNGAISVDLGV